MEHPFQEPDKTEFEGLKIERTGNVIRPILTQSLTGDSTPEQGYIDGNLGSKYAVYKWNKKGQHYTDLLLQTEKGVLDVSPGGSTNFKVGDKLPGNSST